MQQSCWADLPAGLWPAILFLVQPTSRAPSLLLRDRRHSSRYPEAAEAGQALFFRLQLVCQAFVSAMGQLDVTLFLEHTDIDPNSLNALTSWCQKRSCHVKCLVSRTAGPVFDAAMAGFHPQWSVLTQVVLDMFPKRVLSRLVHTHASSELMLLTRGPSISLQALQHLPKLTDLELAHGRFMDVDAAVHLTKLVLILCEANSSQTCGFVDTLVELRLLRNAFLANFHMDGVAACRCLQSLQCCGSIYDIDTDEPLSLCF